MFQCDKMNWNIYKITWYFLQFIFNVVYIIRRLSKYVVSTTTNLSQEDVEKSLISEKYLIEQKKRNLDKIPTHLAVILGTETPNFQILSKIIFWCFSAGIPNISFYDHQGTFTILKIILSSNFSFIHIILGILVSSNHKMYEYLSRWRKDNDDKICWNMNTRDICGSQITYKNGFKKELSVNFLSPRECKSKIVEVCRSLASEKDLSLNNINVQAINKEMSKIVKPDPDLAIYFGDEICSTYGFLPWHIRLTEFLPIASQQSMTVYTFLGTLFKFAKCEQRLGY